MSDSQPQQYDDDGDIPYVPYHDLPTPDLHESLRLLAQLPLDHVPEPAPLPRGSYHTVPQDPHFTGRRQQLLELAASLKEGQPVIIGGPSGIGKSALANAFAHRYGRHFAGGVFRISFAHPDAIRAQLVACGHAMRLSPTFESYPRPEQEYKVGIIDDEVVEEE